MSTESLPRLLCILYPRAMDEAAIVHHGLLQSRDAQTGSHNLTAFVNLFNMFETDRLFKGLGDTSLYRQTCMGKGYANLTIITRMTYLITGRHF